MDVVIPKISNWKAEITVPASKSYSQRALLLSLLTDQPIIIKGMGSSDDEIAAFELVFHNALIEYLDETTFKIQNQFDFRSDVELFCGESGLLSRMCSMLFLLNKSKTTIIGEKSLLSRPLNAIETFYENHNIEYKSNNHLLPLEIIKTNEISSTEIDGSFSSQNISGLLYYYIGKKSDETIYLTIDNVKSRPYIDMTINMLKHLNADIKWIDEKQLEIKSNTVSEKIEIEVEKDWSSAAVWAVTAAIGGEMRLKGLNPNSLQADKKILEVIRDFGAEVIWENEDVLIKINDKNPIIVDATDSPDLIPILVVLAYYGSGETEIKGIHRLVNKESNRKEAILTEMKKVGCQIEAREDSFFIKANAENHSNNKRIIMDTYGDHRLVMAWSILGLYSSDEIVVKGSNSVSKSYPNFFMDLNKLI